MHKHNLSIIGVLVMFSLLQKGGNNPSNEVMGKSRLSFNLRRKVAHAENDCPKDETQTRRFSPILSRRALTTSVSLGMVAAVVVGSKAHAATIPTQFNVTSAPFNADPSGNADSTAAFQAALTALEQAGQGTIYVPSGNYKLLGPLTCTNANLTMYGDGQASSVLMIEHAATALNYTTNSPCQNLTIRDIGFSPVGQGGTTGTAIALNFPAGASGWQRCSIRDIDLGVPRPNYTTFMCGLALNNVWRGNFRNVNMHSNVGNLTGSSFATLSGKCIDNRFNNISVDGIDVAFNVMSYSEGLHLNDCVIIGNVGLYTGNSSYSGVLHESSLVNLLGLYISNCEFNCVKQSLLLYQVISGWISASHFGSQSAINMQFEGCMIQMSELLVTGAFNQFAPWAESVGIWLGPSNAANQSNCVTMDSIMFQNQQIGIALCTGTTNCTASAVRFMAPGCGAMVAVPTQVGNGSFSVYPVLDWSGNTSNVCQMMSSAPTLHNTSSKLSYSQ